MICISPKTSYNFEEVFLLSMLSIVSTPIGNLEDITLRALRTLREADHIACEDTRTTGKLLEHYEIPNDGRLLSFHSHSGFSKVERIIELLNE